MRRSIWNWPFEVCRRAKLFLLTFKYLPRLHHHTLSGSLIRPHGICGNSFWDRLEPLFHRPFHRFNRNTLGLLGVASAKMRVLAVPPRWVVLHWVPLPGVLWSNTFSSAWIRTTSMPFAFLHFSNTRNTQQTITLLLPEHQELPTAPCFCVVYLPQQR